MQKRDTKRIYWNKYENRVQIGPIEIDGKTGTNRTHWNKYENGIQIGPVEIEMKTGYKLDLLK